MSRRALEGVSPSSTCFDEAQEIEGVEDPHDLVLTGDYQLVHPVLDPTSI